MDSQINYTVVVNAEEQYSIWPTFKEVPAGWSEAGYTGNKEDCLEYIDSIWTDITPKSVRDSIRLQRAG